MINFNRLTYLTLLLLLSLSTGFAQSAPGYLGKRDIISYRGLIGPGFQPSGPEIDYNVDGSRGEYDLWGLFYENQLSYERVMSRKFSLRTSLSQQSFHFGTSILNEGFYFGDDYYRLESFIPGNAMGIEIAARWYYKHFAPLGWYYEIFVGYQNVSYGEVNFEWIGSSSNPNIVIEPGSRSLFPVGFGWGYQRIFEDKYLVGFGTQISYAFASPPDNYFDAIPDQESLEESVKKAAGAGASSGRLFPFYFTLGYLL